MSIKVDIRKLTPWRDDVADQIRVEKLNEVVEDYAREIVNELGAIQCDHHPFLDSHIIVVADRSHYITIEKEFCCDQFEKKLSVKLER